MPSKLHEKAIRMTEFEYYLRGYKTIEYYLRGYKTIMNSTDATHIPDLLLVSPMGKIIWIEIESNRNKEKIMKFRELRSKLKLISAKFHIRYLHQDRKLTVFGKRVSNNPIPEWVHVNRINPDFNTI